MKEEDYKKFIKKIINDNFLIFIVISILFVIYLSIEFNIIQVISSLLQVKIMTIGILKDLLLLSFIMFLPLLIISVAYIVLKTNIK